MRRRHLRSQRNGNTIILVVGILVLLVIIATAYVTRTHAGRVTANASLRATLRDDNARVIGDMLAQEIALALFAFPIDPSDPNVFLGLSATSNHRRFSPLRNPVRHSIDQDVIDNATLLPPADGLPDFPYNFAPYHVAPWTNWPDANGDFNWPSGDGNPGGGLIIDGFLWFGEDNPIGNPGFGDTRWLADLEPLRITLDDGSTGFSHWRHMSNIARPNNAWRIVADIGNVGTSLVTDLSIPVEQWLVVSSNTVDTVTGNTGLVTAGNFWTLWENWFTAYKSSYFNAAAVLPNFYKLNDYDLNGVPDNLDERPESEFEIGGRRNAVSRVFADTDGDGYTDAFWFLAPTNTESGIRQVVAVRIIDNSSMANANVMTRADVFGGVTNASTTGATPSDGALVGHSNVGLTDLQVGFLDNIEHHEGVAFTGYGGTLQSFDNQMWDSFTTTNPNRDLNILQQLGIRFDDGTVHSSFDPLEPLSTAVDRHRYWLWSASRPFDPIAGLTPFSLADEIELRMFYGSNYPWILSRFERATQPNVRFEGSAEIFRANPQRQESNEYMDQLQNWELAFDMRHRLTMYSGARNDLMPAWLWFHLFPDFNRDGLITDGERRQFEADRRKFDLRRTNVLDEFGAVLNQDVDGDGEVEPDVPAFGDDIPPDDDLNDDGVIDNVDLYYRLAQYIERALIDRTEDGAYVDDNLADTRRLAYSLAANIMSYRDADREPLLPLEGLKPDNVDARYVGFERQPFLVETVIAHVHEGTEALVDHPGVAAGDTVICGNSDSSTIVLVQVANPFDKDLDLSPFEIKVFGDTHNLSGALGAGASRIYYSIEGELDENELEGEWFGLLSMDGPGVDTEPVTAWSGDRDDYDTGNDKEAVEIHRNFTGGASMLVDRMAIESPNGANDFEFGEEVTDLDEILPTGDCANEPGNDEPWDVINIGLDDHWIQWVHAARAWEGDLYGTPGIIEAAERNPRYVFSFREVSSQSDGEASDDLVPDTAFADLSDSPNGRDNQVEINNGNVDVESSLLNFSMQMLVKDDDFEQVGELLNVWAWGHELNSNGDETRTTFSEFMADEAENLPSNNLEDTRAKVFVNRLRLAPVDLGATTLSPVIGNGADANTGLFDLRHFEPTVPAGVRLLDAFVCDGAGALPTANDFAFNNAIGFSDKITPGLINLNTAALEVLRANPHWTRLTHVINAPGSNPWMRTAEGLVRYREAMGDHTDIIGDLLPGYADRGKDTFIDNLRGTRGIAAIAELGLIRRSAAFTDPNLIEFNDAYRIDYPGLGPYGDYDANGDVIPQTAPSARISLDVNEPRDSNNDEIPDEVAMDAEERNMLLAGAANMVSTRSDVFTVYFKVRSFRQTPVGPNGFPVWDATNREQIVDDSRYVMLVDRSEVNHPDDKPKILYFEKLPR